MGEIIPESTEESARRGALNFLVEETESSLFRNGKVYTRRDGDGSDSRFVGVRLESHTLDIRNARKLSGVTKKTCEANGFELLDAPLDNPSLDFLDHQQVVESYYRQCEDLVSQSTGARYRILNRGALTGFMD